MVFNPYICDMERDLEEWKDVPVVGYEGLYQVSNMGRVRSVDRVIENSIGKKCYYKGRVLKLSVDGNGYYLINLSKEGKRKAIKVHQLVAMAFLGHKPNGMDRVVDHVNGDKLNNNVSNLQLTTNRENTSKDRVGSSKFIGVSWHKQMKKWRVEIRINGPKVFLGLFHNEEEAGRRYQLALSNINKYNGNPKEFRDYLQSIS